MFSYLAPITRALHGINGQVLASLYFVNSLGGVIGNLASVRLIRRIGPGRIAVVSGIAIAVAFLAWPLVAMSLAAIFVPASRGVSRWRFPPSQQTRLVMVNPSLASATIAMNSSVGYLGTSLGTMIGASAWNPVGPRFMPWIGLSFIVASLGCSYLGERAVREGKQLAARGEKQKGRPKSPL